MEGELYRQLIFTLLLEPGVFFSTRGVLCLAEKVNLAKVKPQHVGRPGISLLGLEGYLFCLH